MSVAFGQKSMHNISEHLPAPDIPDPVSFFAESGEEASILETEEGARRGGPVSLDAPPRQRLEAPPCRGAAEASAKADGERGIAFLPLLCILDTVLYFQAAEARLAERLGPIVERGAHGH